MSQTRVATKDTSFNHILELARQLELPERARLVAYLAADVELSLFQQPLPLAMSTAEKRRKLIERLQQGYGHLLTPSDEFARRKQEEIDREEQQI